VETSSLTGVSDADGRFVLTLTSEKIGTASITATAEGTAITVGSPAEVTFVAGDIDYDKSSIEVLRTGAVADGVDENSVRVNLLDAFDNPVSGADVEYTVTGLGSVEHTSELQARDADVCRLLTLNSEKIGTARITATAEGTAI